MSRVEKAKEFNALLKRQKSAVNDALPQLLTEGIKLANGDAGKARVVCGSLGGSASLMNIREWVVNIITQPGDLVYDPQKKFVYAYSGVTVMTHTNATFFPGASGVYYWAIIPNIKEGVKVYPNISGIVVAVKKGEAWWNTTETKKFIWKGADNSNCSWPPVSGNEWQETT